MRLFSLEAIWTWERNILSLQSLSLPLYCISSEGFFLWCNQKLFSQGIHEKAIWTPLETAELSLGMDSQAALESGRQEPWLHQEQTGHTLHRDGVETCVLLLFSANDSAKDHCLFPSAEDSNSRERLPEKFSLCYSPNCLAKGRAGSQSSHYRSNRLYPVERRSFPKANWIPDRKWTLGDQKTKISSA